MTEIITFPQKAITYPEISVKTLSQAVKNIWRLAHQQKSGIEIIQEKILRIGVCSRDIDEAARDSIPQLQAVLRQLPPQDYFQTLIEIDTALENPELDEETRNTLLEARSEEISSLNKDIKNVISNLHKEANIMASKIADVRNVIIVERLEESLKEEQERKAELQADITQKEQNKAKLLPNRNKIIESQDIIRQYNLADMFKDYIPNVSELDKLNLDSPKKELIKQAIKQGVEIAKKILGHISTGLKYIELADARIKLDAQISQLGKDCDDLKTQLKGVEQRIAGIENAHQIDKERTTLLLQATKLEQIWTTFANQLQETTDNKTSQQDLSKLINNQLAFLDDLALQYHTMILH
ncbi:alpha-xenorhabdolysin family binary toxin subunit B [Photorhabdus heterorhabditis]|uniref:alpha-xenorhabdolysin family binary toxin subunit B n=1 Tax=Photorhabdus heterorhabditis TaxID=880156 RepID=UPI0015626ED0|nr:alpha-xenorhabdolysin family binary toxin subunit B [Photorhabdus heterorhabditis]NRN29747.1 alpha-xenorhabdolysin family binary toxin subunit B [Photorhabdus heterorhabditis subsp. aluminescens]